MKKIRNLSELLVDNLGKIHASEQAQYSALPDIRQKANSPALRNSIDIYEKAKEENLKRLQRCFDALDAMLGRNKKCDVVQQLIGDCGATTSQASEPDVSDAALIGTLQQLNHINIANFGTAASYAKTLEKDKVATILREAMEDEKSIDKKLSEIAEDAINPSAAIN